MNALVEGLTFGRLHLMPRLSDYTQLTKSRVTTFIGSLDRIRGENEADEVDDKAIRDAERVAGPQCNWSHGWPRNKIDLEAEPFRSGPRHHGSSQTD